MLPLAGPLAVKVAALIATGFFSIGAVKIEDSIRKSRENEKKQEIIKQDTTDNNLVYVVNSVRKIEKAKSLSDKIIITLEKESKN